MPPRKWGGNSPNPRYTILASRDPIATWRGTSSESVRIQTVSDMKIDSDTAHCLGLTLPKSKLTSHDHFDGRNTVSYGRPLRP